MPALRRTVRLCALVTVLMLGACSCSTIAVEVPRAEHVDQAGDWIPSQHQTTLRLVIYTTLV
jgi:hypothetical protein